MKLILKIIISVVILVFLAYKIDWAELWLISSRAHGPLLLAAGAMMFAENLLVAWRWRLLLVPLSVDSSFMDVLRSYLKGNFAAYFVPAAVTADVVKAVDLNRSRSRGVEVVSSIFVERLFGAMSVSLTVVLGLLLSPLLIGHLGFAQQLVFISIALIAICLASLYVDKLFFLIPERVFKRWPRIASGLHRSRESFETYRSRPRILAGAMALSLIIQMLRVASVYMIGLAIGAGDNFYAYVVAVPVVYLFNMVPVIGSRIGTEQGMFVLLLGMSGITAEASMTVALLSLALGLITVLPGGYWLLRNSDWQEISQGRR